jgi:hypothetical protein
MTMMLRPGQSVDDLVESETGSCPVCGGPLRKWGYSRWRLVRGAGPTGFRPARVRCVDCKVTQVVLPADVLVRRRDAVAVVGRAWRFFAEGTGVRQVAGHVEVPMETVRGWLRRLRQLAQVMLGWSRSPTPGVAGRPELRRALALLEADAATAGWLGETDLWRFASYRSGGKLLSTPVDPA